MQAGLRPAVNDPFFLTVATRNGTFVVDRLVDDVRAGRIAGLILRFPVEAEISGWPPEVAAEFRSRFEPAGSVGDSYVYRFRGRTPSRP